EFSEKLMPLKIGLDDNGQATAPLLKKLAAKGLSHLEVSDLHREADTKQEFLVAKGTTPGAYLKEQLENIIGYAIEHLPIPKVMRYQLADGQTSVRFVRPAHQLICLWGEQIIPVSVLGIQANRQTQGHRFMGESSFSLATATDYEQTLLEKGQVVASYEKRFEQIKQALQQKAEALNATLGDSPEVEE